MKRKYIFYILMIFAILAGCTKNDDNETNSKDHNEAISKDNNEITTETTQEEEYSAEKADAILDGLGIKSYDIWTYLRPEAGEETDNFLNTDYEKTISDLIDEHGENVIIPEKEEYINDNRKLIHGRYRIEQQEPLIIKVNGKNDNNTGYLSEAGWQELAYFYLSPTGYLFKDNDKWYEIPGYGDYKTDYWSVLGSIHWEYWGTEKNSNSHYDMMCHLYGYDKRDGDEYNEEKVKERFFPTIYDREKEECKDGSCTYMCDNLTVHTYYRVYSSEGKRDVYIGFYTMMDEYRAVTCTCRIDDVTTDYYNDITEEKLREIFTIREYK